MWRRSLTLGTVAMLVLSALLTGTAFAEEAVSALVTGKQPAAAHGGGPVVSSLNVRIPNPSGAADAQFTPPYVEYLSSSAWLIANGINPLSADISGVAKNLHAGGPRLVAPGSVSGQGGAGTLVPYRDPSAKFSRNILIPQDFSSAPLQTEPHLAVNPKDPDHLIVGMIDYNFPAVTTYVSIDGGESWEGPIQVKHSRDEIASAGDPVIGFDRNGNAYLIFISIDSQDFEFGNIVGTAAVSNISMAVSTDGGYSWSTGSPANPPTTIEPNSFFDAFGQFRGTLPITFLDKPWLSVGPNPDDPSRDMISISYTKFVSEYGILYLGEVPSLGIEALESVIEVVTSKDLGMTWSKPYEVSPRMRQELLAGQQSEEEASAEGVSVEDANSPISAPGGQVINVRNRLVQGSQPAIAPDGTSYVAWMDSTDDGPFEGLAQMYVARSDDGGETWTAGRRASTFLEPGFSPRTTFFRYWGSAFAQLTVGPGGQVYVGYIGLPAGAPQDDGDLFVVRSVDKGVLWDTPVKVIDDQTNRMQFFPSISAGPDGKLHAMWGDMRDDSKELQYHIYYAVSEDDGKTFGLNARVTDSASNPNWGFPGGQFIGDYFSIQATASDVYMVWADTRLGEFSGTNQKIAFARQRQVPRPSIFLNPPEGAGGQPITIQGFNFQANQALYIQIGGTLVATERTGPEGTFTTNLFVPIAGEGAHAVSVFDASGNFSSSSYFMSFGFDTIRDTADQVDETARDLAALKASLGPNFTTELAGALGVDALSIELAAIQQSITDLRETQTALRSEVGDFGARGQRTALVLALVAGGAAILFAIGAGATAYVRRSSRPGNPSGA